MDAFGADASLDRKPPRVSKRALALPDMQRDKMRQLALFMRRLYEASGLSQELITERANRYFPGLSKGTIARLALPSHMVTQSDVGYLLLDAVLTALGSSHAELAEALHTSAAVEDEERAHEQEQAFVQLIRTLSPLGREYLLEDAQRYLRRESQEAVQPRAASAVDTSCDGECTVKPREQTAS